MALVAEVRAAGALSSLPGESSPSLRSELGWALDDVPGGESRALQLRLQRQADVGCADQNDALFGRHGLDLLIEEPAGAERDRGPEGGSQSCHAVSRRRFTDRDGPAARNGLRGCLAVLICAILLSLGGWPFASQGLAVVGSIVALSAINPNLHAFAASAVIAMVIAALLAGVTEFLILDGVDQFPLLAIGMAPSILFAALWSTKQGFLVLVFVPVILSPRTRRATTRKAISSPA